MKRSYEKRKKKREGRFYQKRIIICTIAQWEIVTNDVNPSVLTLHVYFVIQKMLHSLSFHVSREHKPTPSLLLLRLSFAKKKIICSKPEQKNNITSRITIYKTSKIICNRKIQTKFFCRQGLNPFDENLTLKSPIVKLNMRQYTLGTTWKKELQLTI